MTVRELIKNSMRLIGAIGSNETPSAVEEADALQFLNDLLDGWTDEGLLNYETVREVFTFTASLSPHSIGVGGDFNTTWPSKILGIASIENGAEVPLTLITQDEWMNIRLKSTSGTLPTKAYIQSDYPLKKIFCWPVPSTSKQVAIYSRKQLTNYTSLSTQLSLPPGYLRALRYNLAVELAPDYGKQVSELVFNAALESKNDLRRANTTPVCMENDLSSMSVGKTWNWITGG